MIQQEQQYQKEQCIPKCQNCFQKYEEQLCGMHKCNECEYNICEKCIIQQTPYCQMGHKYDLLILDIKNQKMMKKMKTHFCDVCSNNLGDQILKLVQQQQINLQEQQKLQNNYFCSNNHQENYQTVPQISYIFRCYQCDYDICYECSEKKFDREFTFFTALFKNKIDKQENSQINQQISELKQRESELQNQLLNLKNQIENVQIQCNNNGNNKPNEANNLLFPNTLKNQNSSILNQNNSNNLFNLPINKNNVNLPNNHNMINNKIGDNNNSYIEFNKDNNNNNKNLFFNLPNAQMKNNQEGIFSQDKKNQQYQGLFTIKDDVGNNKNKNDNYGLFSNLNKVQNPQQNNLLFSFNR